jgi:hypothetical protein
LLTHSPIIPVVDYRLNLEPNTIAFMAVSSLKGITKPLLIVGGVSFGLLIAVLGHILTGILFFRLWWLTLPVLAIMIALAWFRNRSKKP